jgi:hypothetical protein
MLVISDRKARLETAHSQTTLTSVKNKASVIFDINKSNAVLLNKNKVVTKTVLGKKVNLGDSDEEDDDFI